MSSLKELQRYLNKDIENYGGITSPEYRSFERKFKNYIEKVMIDNGGELVKFNPNHYEFSCFVKRNNKYLYISISDVRYFKNSWYNNILIRTANNEKDYSGGRNDYTSLQCLDKKIVLMTN